AAWAAVDAVTCAAGVAAAAVGVASPDIGEVAAVAFLSLTGVAPLVAYLALPGERALMRAVIATGLLAASAVAGLGAGLLLLPAAAVPAVAILAALLANAPHRAPRGA
ncbi:MAG: hypothetical protein AB1416_12010, partial [Actinomycetota bacterium]